MIPENIAIDKFSAAHPVYFTLSNMHTYLFFSKTTPSKPFGTDKKKYIYIHNTI